MSSREAILARLRAAGRPVPTQVAPYRPVFDEDLVRRFRSRIGMVFGSAEEIASLAGLPAAVMHYLAAQSQPPAAAIADEFAALDWNGAGLQRLAPPARGSMPAAVSRVAVAIAETGSLMMSSRDPNGPWPNLLADIHIAVVARAAIVPSFEEAVARIAGNRLPRSLHVATGPSRTGDIEQTLELGAHGAVRLHVVIVNEEISR